MECKVLLLRLFAAGEANPPNCCWGDDIAEGGLEGCGCAGWYQRCTEIGGCHPCKLT